MRLVGKALIVVGITALLGACAVGEPRRTADISPTTLTVPPLPEYAPFDDVDPYTNLYFVTLEDTDLAESQGEERLYNLGVNVCTRLDAGQTIEQQLTDDAGLGDQIGSIVGAAVTDLCPHHSALVEQYLAANQ